MSEYQERHTVSRLVGRAARLRRLRRGRPAHGSGAPQAVLRRAVRRDREGALPTCSTHCSRCSTTGGLTDSQGRTVNFRNTVVIMTSNIGSDVPDRGHDARRRDQARSPRAGDGRATPPLPARVPQPNRRRRAVQVADGTMVSERQGADIPRNVWLETRRCRPSTARRLARRPPGESQHLPAAHQQGRRDALRPQPVEPSISMAHRPRVPRGRPRSRSAPRNPGMSGAPRLGATLQASSRPPSPRSRGPIGWD